ncbi:MAG: replication-associated recombination protein A [Syntrophales bacterium]|nr:replication-associated recombination protein A [Syntrophales bacterium]
MKPPLAERMRPRNLGEFVGQSHLLGPGALLRRAIEDDRLFSMIFWGPPGSGKTTLAHLIAKETNAHFVSLSAVLSGIKELKGIIEEAAEYRDTFQQRTVLFVDEIHRFNKAQQDAFLPHVESGLITLIGATTENPSFEIIAPLLSRCHVFVLYPYTREELHLILARALNDMERGLGKEAYEITKEAADLIVWTADGDARMVLNSLEAAVSLLGKGEKKITQRLVEEALQKKPLLYDRAGEEHFNLISALHKSLRGSDPDAAIYWLMRMLMAGEDPFYIARRMVRFASEDVGLADPHALTVAMSAMEAYRFLGSPEGELALLQAAVYLATAPKSNALYVAEGEAKKIVRETGTLPVPLHLRNAPTTLMRDMGYGVGYLYPHDDEEAVVDQTYLPEALKDKGVKFYRPVERGYEKKIAERMAYWETLRKKRRGV